MVSTERLYFTDNNLPFRRAQDRGEYFYIVRIFSEQAPYLSKEIGLQRMKVLLGFLEARCVVLDAIIKNDNFINYLSFICSSQADPMNFSRIMKKNAPQCLIEQIDSKKNRISISKHFLVNEQTPIPYSKPIMALNESKKIILSLLLEYRALYTEYSVSKSTKDSLFFSRLSQTSNLSPFSVSFLFFEKDGMRMGLPEFQIKQIYPGANGAYFVEPFNLYGNRIIQCSELLPIREINIPTCTFLEKKDKGFYRVISKTKDNKELEFILIVPSFM